MAITVLANWMRRATEQIAHRAGGAIGGLLNVSFGSIAELVLALFVLASGQRAVVQGQITGSIIGTSLLGLGLAMLGGGIGRQTQKFNRASTGLLSTLLFLVVIALILPAVFDRTQRSLTQASVVVLTDEHLSLAVSFVLLLMYGANLVYTMITHRDVFARVRNTEARNGAWVARSSSWRSALPRSHSRPSWFRTRWARRRKQSASPRCSWAWLCWLWSARQTIRAGL